MQIKTWKEFEIYFNKVHPNFTKNLLKKYPNLKPSELKFCSFLRLNFNTKKISSIIFITPESVKTTRTRLRKKLKLKRSTFFTSANFFVTFEILKCLFTDVNFNYEISKKP